MRIEPTERELQLFALLGRVLGPPDERGRAAWVAGGWVRDRLLGRPCTDLDIAVAGLGAGECARRVLALGAGARPGVRPRAPRSRALDAAALVFHELAVDFTALRREVYDADSRIPATSTAGVTLGEDARRRDFTLNALYFDLTAGRIEDPLGEGLADLRAGRIRTPIDPLRSFEDDPLRLLRAIRFAACLGCELGVEIRAGVVDERWARVRAALERKLSRERIWDEMVGRRPGGRWKAGFLTGEAPARALCLLEELALRELLLAPAAWSPASWRRAVARVERLGRRPSQGEERAALALAALLRDGCGATAAREVLACWRAPRALARRVIALLEHRGRTADLVLPLGARDLLAVGFRPGPALGRALAAVRAARRRDPALSRAEALAIAVRFLGPGGAPPPPSDPPEQDDGLG